MAFWNRVLGRGGPPGVRHRSQPALPAQQARRNGEVQDGGGSDSQRVLEGQQVIGRVEPDLDPGGFLHQLLEKRAIRDGKRVHHVPPGPVIELDEGDVDAVAVKVVLPLHVHGKTPACRCTQVLDQVAQLRICLDEIVGSHRQVIDARARGVVNHWSGQFSLTTPSATIRSVHGQGISGQQRDYADRYRGPRHREVFPGVCRVLRHPRAEVGPDGLAGQGADRFHGAPTTAGPSWRS